MEILATEEDGGVLRVTASIADDDHRFEVSAENGEAVISYEETLSWRGVTRVSEPDDDIFREVMVSNEVTDFLDTHDLDGIRRETATL